MSVKLSEINAPAKIDKQVKTHNNSLLIKNLKRSLVNNTPLSLSKKRKTSLISAKNLKTEPALSGKRIFINESKLSNISISLLNPQQNKIIPKIRYIDSY